MAAIEFLDTSSRWSFDSIIRWCGERFSIADEKTLQLMVAQMRLSILLVIVPVRSSKQRQGSNIVLDPPGP
jgi:hypothetical protein